MFKRWRSQTFSLAQLIEFSVFTISAQSVANVHHNKSLWTLLVVLEAAATNEVLWSLITWWQQWEKDGWQWATSEVHSKDSLKAGKVRYWAVGCHRGACCHASIQLELIYSGYRCQESAAPVILGMVVLGFSPRFQHPGAQVMILKLLSNWNDSMVL